MSNDIPVTRRRSHKKKGSDLLPILSLTLAAVVLSLGLAGIWQLLDPVDYIPPEEPSSNLGGILPTGDSGASEGDESQPPAEPSSEESSSAASGPDVAQGDWVPSAYFDDAMFVGDSITDGIKLYEVMSNATVLANTGINLDSIFTKVVSTPSGEKTIMEASKDYDPGKIYLLMGINSMLSGEDAFIKSYERVVDELMAQHPGAILYIQSILPVTAEYETRQSAVTDNATIDAYNLRLRAMAEEKGVYYLNVAEVFKDETGALYAEASPKDGIHFGATWYRKWFDYLRTHAAVDPVDA